MFKKIAFGIFILFAVVSLVFALRNDRDVTTSSEVAYEHYQKAEEFMEQLYHREAARELEKAVEADSSFALALAELSMMYGELGFKEKSEKLWERALAVRDQVSERERMLLNMWDANKEHDTATVRKLANKYIDSYPRYHEGYMQMASIKMAANDYESAIEYYAKALEVDPDYGNAHNMLGYLNYFLGRYDEALRHLEEYSRLAPNEANPHDSRGEILHALGRYEAAIEEFREAFNINPEFAYAIEHMAWSYLALGRMDKVEYCFSTLTDRAESDERRHYFMQEYGSALLYAHQYDSALVLFDRILADDPENMAALMNIGYTYYLLRDQASAMQYFDSLRVVYELEMEEMPQLKDQQSMQIAVDRVKAMQADLRGDLDEAGMLMSNLIDRLGIPTQKMSYRYQYADILFRAGDFDLAKSELQKNLSTNPNHARSLLLLADIYEAEGQHQSAMSYRQKVMEIWQNADRDFKPMLELEQKIEAALASTSPE
jgi:tetratricopeptide (TPR) repeat protein